MARGQVWGSVLTAVGGNKSLAARIVGFDYKMLYRKLAQYGLEDQ